MVLLGGVETVSGAIVGAMVFKALNIWLVSQTDMSKLVLGAMIILLVVAFPSGIAGMAESVRERLRTRGRPALSATKSDGAAAAPSGAGAGAPEIGRVE
jgi:branched-chain amino acid transport system permease protein